MKMPVNSSEINIVIPSIKSEMELVPLIQEIKETARGSYNIIPISNSEKSAAQNRNLGLELCEGRFIVMVDDDISDFTIGWNEELVRQLRYEAISIVSARLMESCYKVGATCSGNYDTLPYIVQVPRVPSACIAFRNTDKRFDENCRIFEDVDFCRQLGPVFVIANTVRVVHRNEMKNQSREIGKEVEVYYRKKWGVYP